MGQGALKPAAKSALGKKIIVMIIAKKPAWFPRFFEVVVLKEMTHPWESSSLSPGLTCCKQQLLVANGTS